MLGRPREAGDPAHERVVAAVGRRVAAREQGVEAIPRGVRARLGDGETERAQPRRRHLDQQGRLAFPPGAQVGDAAFDELTTGQMEGNLGHGMMVEPGAAASSPVRSPDQIGQSVAGPSLDRPLGAESR